MIRPGPAPVVRRRFAQPRRVSLPSIPGRADIARASLGMAARDVRPVGSVYITTDVDDDPNVTVGYGTWERFAEGSVLLGGSE